MKNIFTAMGFALCLTATMSMAQTTNTIPYEDSFESYAAGSNLIGTVWQGDTNSAIAIVTSLNYSASAGYPLTNANHTKVMAFRDGTITNEFDGTTSNLTVVAIDTMLLPVFAETPTGAQMEAVSNSQASIFIDTNGFINAYSGVINDPYPTQPVSVGWTVLSNTTPIGTGNWIRLTIVMSYAPNIVMYKVGVNGNFMTSTEGYATNDVGSTKGSGVWLVSPDGLPTGGWASYDSRLHRVVLSGSGMLDDMVVTTNEIAFTPPVGPAYATNGTSIAWMQGQGLSTNGTYPTWDDVAMADEDGDGAPTWSEFYAGTQPTNLASTLKIVSLTYSNGLPLLKWIGSSNALAPYAVQWSSNLMSIGNWTPATNNLPITQGTNETSLPLPVSNPAFLQVIVETIAP
jgi:hypothetical protein